MGVQRSSALALLVLILLACGPTEQEQFVTVLDRYWVASTVVMYDDSSYECGPDPFDPGEISCGWETDTITRCMSREIGYELPVVWPEPACQVWFGDYVDRYLRYVLVSKVAESGEVRTDSFDHYLWHDLPRGSQVRVKFTRSIGTGGWTAEQVLSRKEGE